MTDRPNPLRDPTRPPTPEHVAIHCHGCGRFVSWCAPPAPPVPTYCPGCAGRGTESERMTSMTDPPCARCGRESPPQDSDYFTEWEALGDGTAVVCPGCITPEEQAAIDDEAMHLADTTGLGDPSDPRSDQPL